MKEKIFLLFFIIIFPVHLSFSQTIIPISDELILPQFAIGGSGGGSSTGGRLQFLCRLRLTGLIPNATYRYFTGASDNTSISGPAPGAFFVLNNTSGPYGYITGYSTLKSMGGMLMDKNEFISSNRYGEFCSDDTGSYSGWFSFVCVSGAVFNAGNLIYVYVQINNGTNGSSISKTFRTTSTVKILDYGYTSGHLNQATAVTGKSFANAEDIILLYDNTSGTGRPIFATFAENDGISTSFTTWYAKPNGPDGINGRWGAILPNNLPNGLQRIDRRNIANNDLIDLNISTDGMWGTVNTVNPSGGTTALIIDSIYAPLPVNLAYFKAYANKNSVILDWSTFQEINNSGFKIQRSDNKSEWQDIAFVKGKGNSKEQQYYSFRNLNLNTGSYEFRLKQVDFNGNFEIFNLPGNVRIEKPGEFKVSQNYPNPSNPVTRIDYQIPVAGKVQIKIYNIAGREVENLVDRNMEAGFYNVTFNSINFASGVYFYNIKVSSNNTVISKTMKMVIIK